MQESEREIVIPLNISQDYLQNITSLNIDDRGENLYWLSQNRNTSEFEIQRLPLVDENGFSIKQDNETIPKTWPLGNWTDASGLVYESPFIYYIGNSTYLVQLDPRTNSSKILSASINST